LGAVGFCKGSALSRIFWKSSNRQQQKQRKQQQQDSQRQNSKGFGRWRKKLLFLGVSIGFMVSVWLFLSINASIISRRKENIATMCDERARMLQDQFNVSMNHVNALAILVSTFHHGKRPSAIDQVWFAYWLHFSLQLNVTWGSVFVPSILEYLDPNHPLGDWDSILQNGGIRKPIAQEAFNRIYTLLCHLC